MHSLDFALLPKLTVARMFAKLDEAALQGIAKYCRVLARAKNAAHFAYFSTLDADLLACKAEDLANVREGFFRAALTELVSIEDVQRLDFEDLGEYRRTLRLTNSTNPLLHVIRELRNLEVHLRHSELRERSIQVLWGSPEEPDKALAMTLSIWSVEGLSVESFSTLRNAKHYRQSDIDAMVNWFNDAQQKWGILELFLLAVDEYCRMLSFDQYAIGNADRG